MTIDFSSAEPAGHSSHSELGTVADMLGDCRGTQRNLGLRSVEVNAPSLLFADYPSDLPKAEISVSKAAARLAAAYYAD